MEEKLAAYRWEGKVVVNETNPGRSRQWYDAAMGTPRFALLSCRNGEIALGQTEQSQILAASC